MKTPGKFLLALAPAALAAAAVAGGFSPFVERSPLGSVDWEAGVIHARGEWKLKNPKDPDELTAAERGAEVKAQRNALLLAQKINLTGERELGEDPEAVKVITVSGKLVGARVTGSERRGNTLVVTVDAPLTGAESVLAAIARDFRERYLPPPAAEPEPGPAMAGSSPASPSASAPAPAPPSAPDRLAANSAPRASESREVPVVIDARGTGAKPALLPKVKSAEGTPVYTASNVNYQSLLDGGQAKYVVATRGAAGRNPFGCGPRLAADPAPASAGVRVRAARAEGAKQGDLVLAPGEAKKLQDPGARAAMKAGKVLVVMDSAVGGVEGSLGCAPEPFRIALR